MTRAVRTGMLILTVPVLVVLAIVATSLLASDDSNAGGDDGLVIAGFAFHPDPLRVDADAVVPVTNDDAVTHTVTAEDGTFDTGEIEGGGRAQITVNGPGEISYFCQIHESMRGTIEVG